MSVTFIIFALISVIAYIDLYLRLRRSYDVLEKLRQASNKNSVFLKNVCDNYERELQDALKQVEIFKFKVKNIERLLKI